MFLYVYAPQGAWIFKTEIEQIYRGRLYTSAKIIARVCISYAYPTPSTGAADLSKLTLTGGQTGDISHEQLEE